MFPFQLEGVYTQYNVVYGHPIGIKTQVLLTRFETGFSGSCQPLLANRKVKFHILIYYLGTTSTYYM